ncbi:MAG: hypothetical protein J7J29_05420 [Psychrobacter sp.]|jgi:hypothetical protein|uniref:hypothetical protein n=1 Tax=Psychrobacter TaxID=497 RepID=UPI000ED18972|nr:MULTISPECIES: hypothetical protein [Psychrobacter]MCD1280007.1 hypothetical protein [Psychrobacter sp. CCUG 69069]MCD6251741.1 hypothetical protein [Psychrobacter sp.]HCN17152.1 hypothetical protein [Psychrobacter sp.]|tara:strand:- start:1576 stop:2262 length:687 start_codon:yes stop_codon:yes gene_type:complete
MNKKRYALWTGTIFATSLLLSGCQLLTGYQKIDEAESAKKWAGKIHPIAGEVNIACVGTYHCEIVQIDKTLVIAPDTHEPVNSRMLVNVPSVYAAKNTVKVPANMKVAPLANKSAIKIVPLAASGMPGLTNYYARVMPAKREVHVNFYPENNIGYVERFAMIHDFVEAGTYQLRAYQKKSSERSGSLLETASPEPLCIELLQGSKVQRRFCKQLDTEHQGEFVETSMI